MWESIILCPHIHGSGKISHFFYYSITLLDEVVGTYRDANKFQKALVNWSATIVFIDHTNLQFFFFDLETCCVMIIL